MGDSIYLTKVVKGAGIVFLGLFFGHLLGYLTRIFIARFLGAGSYGIISLGLAILGFFYAFSLLGLSGGLTRFISYYKDERERRGILLTTLKISVLLSILLSIFLFIFSSHISFLLNKPDLIPILQIFAFSLPFYTLLGIFVSSFRGFQKPLYKIYINDFAFELAKISLISLAIFLGFGIIGVAVGWAISFILLALISGIVLQKKVFPVFRTNIKPIYLTKELLHFSLPLLFTFLLTLIVDYTDIIMLGYFHNSDIVGIYNSALPTATMLTLFIYSFSYLFMPIVSYLYSKRELNEFKKLYKSVSRWIYLSSFPIFLLFISYPHLILNILFGSTFIEASTSLRILSVGYFIFTISGLSQQTLLSFGRSKLLFSVTACIALINFIFNLILIPSLKMEGAAISMSSSLIVGSMISIYLVYYLTKTQPFNKNLIRPTIAGIISALIFLIFPGMFPIPVWYVFVGVILFLFFYVFLSLLFKSLTKEDMVIFKVIESRTGIKIKLLRKLIRRFV